VFTLYTAEYTRQTRQYFLHTYYQSSTGTFFFCSIFYTWRAVPVLVRQAVQVLYTIVLYFLYILYVLTYCTVPAVPVLFINDTVRFGTFYKAVFFYIPAEYRYFLHGRHYTEYTAECGTFYTAVFFTHTVQ
jgi:hypothetical protein